MSESKNTSMNNGKSEFMFSKEIGRNYKHRHRFSYSFAENQLKTMIDTFGIKDEPVVLEADILTFTAMLADILQEYSDLIEKDLSGWSSDAKQMD